MVMIALIRKEVTMAGISSLTNSNLYKALYNGNSVSSQNKSNDIFSALGSNTFSDLSMIKSGTYKKLLSAYYEKYGRSGSGDSNDAVSTEISNLSRVSSNASDLKDSVSRLRKIDFSKEENGESSLAAAKDFAENYNALIDNSVNVNRQGVLKDTLSLVNYMKKNSGMLNELGMKLGTDNKITFDEDKWKNAYSTSKSSMFNGVGSFGYQAAYKIGKIGSASAAGTGRYTPASTYNGAGKYNAPNNTAQLFNALF